MTATTAEIEARCGRMVGRLVLAFQQFVHPAPSEDAERDWIAGR